MIFAPFRSDGPPSHPVPRVGEHLQLGDCQRAQVRGPDGCRDLGGDVHPTRLLRPQRIRHYSKDHSGKT